ncbi:hypothetical protein ACQEVF_49395 [Nonomuraea polychroma]|uniref:hypothetical protein n=1 Tax=Nonomuraea polychroma TaxID=46176 RepID=UPI003D8A6F3C
MRLDFVAGDEVYGACPTLRAFLEEHRQAYVLGVRATFTHTLGSGTCLTCEQVVAKHLKRKRGSGPLPHMAAGQPKPHFPRRARRPPAPSPLAGLS